jgi:zinc protease
MKYRYAMIALILVVVAFCNSAFAKVYNPEHFTLKNGMEVYVISNHRSPYVSHMVWYKAGSADERAGTYGTAHFLEHLMFKSNENMPSEAFSKQVAKVGGNDNAFTFYEYTAYHQTVSVENLPMVMEMEADRMRSISVSEKDFETERQVILEERLRRTEGKPFTILRDRLNALMWFGTPYSIPLIGFEETIKGIKYSDTIQFHKDWYAPNNAIMVVAGDITAEELKSLAEKYYGSIPARDLPIRNPVNLADLDCDANVVLHHDSVRQPKFMRMYPAVSFTTAAGDAETPASYKDVYATKVLSEIIGSDSTSLMYRDMVIKDKTAISISAAYRASSRGPGTFVFYGVPAEGISKEQFEKAIEKEVSTILNGAITEEDVELAKQTLVAGLIYAVDNPAEAAHALGNAVVLGRELDEIESWADNIKKVTLADVKRMAGQLFDSKNASVTGWVMPAAKPE